MRLLQVAHGKWSHFILISLTIQVCSHGLSAAEYKNNHNFRRTSSTPNSLMDNMMKKFSYPKNEVTAGVGYGHHLHPLYYQGDKEMMYPCAVECGEWVTMASDDNTNDASSNVDVVTVRPDISNIDITTPIPRPYKDVSLLRPKKYQSQTSMVSTPKTTRHNDFANYQDLKGADGQIVPQKANNGYNSAEVSDAKETMNDGSLYARYHNDLISGFEGEIAENTKNKENEYFDPIEDSLRYNPPFFNDDDNDDINSPVYSKKRKTHNPKGERIEEKYVKHNVREEQLEDLRTNSFETSEEEDYPSNFGDQSSSYNPPRYNYQGDYRGAEPKPFKPSPEVPLQNLQQYPPGHTGHFRGGKKPNFQSFHSPHNQFSDQEYRQGYSDYPAEDYSDYVEPDVKPYNTLPRGNRRPNSLQKYPFAKVPIRQRRPLTYGWNGKHPSTYVSGGSHKTSAARFPTRTYLGSDYPRSAYSAEPDDEQPYYPYAPKHGYPPQNQELPGRFNSGGLQVVEPPQRPAHSTQYKKYPYYRKGRSSNFRNSRPFIRGQLIGYRQTIPQKNGFTKIIRKYKSFVDHTPKRYVTYGKPYLIS
ncbi:uncharacterized protein LOC105683053 [Athalia rosae]|uniref:uncharacterized protein LOC105683053 n=1 Tax=Athalia rosae TaxID=37344 RepID=UPI0020333987|nr:uncharacterized protein LOC105683053 [Athalia rosae]